MSRCKISHSDVCIYTYAINSRIWPVRLAWDWSAGSKPIRRYNSQHTTEDPSDVRSGTPEHVVFLDGMDMHQERVVVLNRPVGPLVTSWRREPSQSPEVASRPNCLLLGTGGRFIRFSLATA